MLRQLGPDSPVDVLREICTASSTGRLMGRVQRRVVRRLGVSARHRPPGAEPPYAHLAGWLHPRDHLALAQVLPLPTWNASSPIPI
ncbi:MAG: hypothetical protein IPJ14_23625 [Kineosporiaceae bacterium]|nr:hypothetical protein [Kineosporiaceae bacterium]